MNGNKLKSRLLASSVFAGAALGLAVTPGFAQETEDDEARQQTVTVTGSRIEKLDFVSNSPIATVGAEQFNLTGTVNTESLLNTLPQAVPGLDRTSNNPGNGTATVDLRGLGANRTLVLVDGRRFIPTDSDGVVDINNIPPALVERVEVVTGGASAVYGADAVAGVVNFILKDDFEGVEASVGYEVTGEGDADLWSTALTMGANFDDGRGNAVLSMTYADRAPLFQGDRDFAEVAQFDNADSTGLEPGGSSGVPETSIFNSGLGDFSDSTGIFFNPDGTIEPFVTSGDNNNFYNYAPVNYIQLPQERFTATGMASYEINPSAEVYSRFTFANNTVPQQLAPTPIFQTAEFSLDGNPFIDAGAQGILSGDNTGIVGIGVRESRMFSDVAGEAQTGFVFETDADGNRILDGNGLPNLLNTCVNCLFDASFTDANEDGIDDIMTADTAPLIDTDGDGIADTASGLLRRRMLEVGPRIVDSGFNAFQFTAGLRGEINTNVDYDVYFMEGRVQSSFAQQGNVSRANFNQGLLLADADGDGNVDVDAAGNPTCSDGSGGCVPINLYGQGNITPAAADYLRIRVNGDFDYNQTIFAANLSGNTAGAFELPGGPVGLAGGLEYREEDFDFRPSQDLATGNIAGFNAQPAQSGAFDVYETYAEAYLPFLSEAPFAEILALELAFRYGDYSTVGTVETYKIAGEWAPDEQVRFRASFNTAVRAPNVGELFAPSAEGFPGADDPCAEDGGVFAVADAAEVARVRGVCEATGVPSGQVFSPGINPASGQVRALFGGNPELDVEEADTYTVGVVVSPNFIEGLTASIDYYDIEISGAIASFGGGANNVLDNCYNNTTTGGVGSLFCDVIQRRSDGTIDFVAIQAQNAATQTQNGVDLVVDYTYDAGDMGNFGLAYIGTYTNEQDFTPFEGADVISCAGQFGETCGEPIPEYKHRMTGRWASGPFTTQLVWRHVGSVTDDDEATTFFVEDIDGTNYFDLSGSWQVNDNLALTGGIDNLLDEEPPVIGDNDEQSNTYPATYDVFGRTFFVKGTVSF